LVTVLVAEIVLTMADFIVEIQSASPWETCTAVNVSTHAAMGLSTARCLPTVSHDARSGSAADGPTVDSANITPMLRWCLTGKALGSSFRGMRDLYAVSRACPRKLAWLYGFLPRWSL